eukprot:114829_1
MIDFLILLVIGVRGSPEYGTVNINSLMKDQNSQPNDRIKYPEGCYCNNMCDEYPTAQCGTKCTCEFWYDSTQSAMQDTQHMMDKNAYFRDRFGRISAHYRPGNDYYGRQFINLSRNNKAVNNKPYDRRVQSSGDPYQENAFGKTDSWNRYEADPCYYQLCRTENATQCAWFYDFANCGQDRNNNGRYYDEFFARARLNFASRGLTNGQNNYGLGKLPKTR